MIAQISKYSDEQILTAAHSLLTDNQSARLIQACSGGGMVLTAALTLTVLGEDDYDALTRQGSQSELQDTAIARGLATAKQFKAAEDQRFVRMFCPDSDAPFDFEDSSFGHPNECCIQESAIREHQLLGQLQLLFGNNE